MSTVIEARYLGLLLAMLWVVPSPAAAEVLRISPKLEAYFLEVHPEAINGRLQTPLVMAMPDASRVGQVILPFASEPEALGIERLTQVLDGGLQWQSADTGITRERYRDAVLALAKDLPLRFPLVVLVRIETPDPDSGLQVPETRDEELETALRAWADEPANERHLLVISLQLQ